MVKLSRERVAVHRSGLLGPVLGRRDHPLQRGVLWELQRPRHQDVRTRHELRVPPEPGVSRLVQYDKVVWIEAAQLAGNFNAGIVIDGLKV